MSNSAELVLEFTVGQDGAWQIGRYFIFVNNSRHLFDFPKSKTRRRRILKKLFELLKWQAELSEFNFIRFTAEIEPVMADLILRLTDTEKTPARWLRKIDPNKDPETVKLMLGMVLLAENLK